MPEKLLQYLEKVFREATCSDELFDSLEIALRNKIKNKDLYKIFLSNHVLSKDELMMFTEKICEEFEEFRFDLYYWTASLFQLHDKDLSLIDNAFYYYQKAFLSNPENNKPLLSALTLYNYDFDIPTNTYILQLLNTGIDKVKYKSAVYNELARHFIYIGNEELGKTYRKLAEEKSREENQ
ncbi:MAG: hypothetical protein KKB34_16075 [Bacteroidetes bacterium]|nr:hypothetical protein [Bacteroidota bacterium]